MGCYSYISTDSCAGKLNKARKALMKPLGGIGKKAASGPQNLYKQSVEKIKSKKAEKQRRRLGPDGSPGLAGSEPDTSGAGQDDDDDEEIELFFAEFVFMMRAGMLKQFLPGDWRERAEDMRKLREAFDAADVDGNNELELEELEMCVISMNPKAQGQPADIKKIWDVLNPECKSWIPFSEYVQGMIEVKRDPELSTLIPMDVPNRFQLLSLLIGK